MAYLTPAELKSAMYEYQLQQIIENDHTIALMAIQSAIEEAKSILTPNNKKAWQDGRLLYDSQAIFSAEGNNRNALLLAHTKTIAVWYVTQLANVDMLYEQVKERYDRAIDYLKMLASGDASISALPKLLPSNPDGSPEEKQPFRYSSRKKFNHE